MGVLRGPVGLPATTFSGSLGSFKGRVKHETAVAQEYNYYDSEALLRTQSCQRFFEIKVGRNVALLFARNIFLTSACPGLLDFIFSQASSNIKACVVNNESDCYDDLCFALVRPLHLTRQYILRINQTVLVAKNKLKWTQQL